MEPYHAKNPNFESIMKLGLCSSFTSQEFCDVTFAVGNNLYNAHKLVLSISSIYLKNILLSIPSNYPIVVLTDVRPKILEYLLQFMYSGSVEVPSDDLEDFVSSGMNLQIKGIQSAELELDHVDNTSESSFNNEEELETSSSTLTFSPNSIRTSNPKKRLSNIVGNAPKKAKKKHSVTFKTEPEYYCYQKDKYSKDELPCGKDELPYGKNDLQYDKDELPYGSIMEPEVRIEDDFNAVKPFDSGRLRASQGQHAGYPAGDIDTAVTRFIQTGSGKLHLLCNDYTFHKNTMRKDRIYWLCAAYQSALQCRARCVTIDGKVVSITGTHNHERDYKEKLSLSSDVLLDNSQVVENNSLAKINDSDDEQSNISLCPIYPMNDSLTKYNKKKRKNINRQLVDQLLINQPITTNQPVDTSTIDGIFPMKNVLTINDIITTDRFNGESSTCDM